MQCLNNLGGNLKYRKELSTLTYISYYQEYLSLGEDIYAALFFQGYYTLKYGSWPKDLDEDSL
jgi:hypothetical protein